jgi:hypothetical protein
MTVFLLYMSVTLEEILVAKEVYTAASIIMGFFFITSCQDIACDAWAIEMLHPENAAYGSSS